MAAWCFGESSAFCIRELVAALALGVALDCRKDTQLPLATGLLCFGESRILAPQSGPIVFPSASRCDDGIGILGRSGSVLAKAVPPNSAASSVECCSMPTMFSGTSSLPNFTTSMITEPGLLAYSMMSLNLS